jgi:hypothetical protein
MFDNIRRRSTGTTMLCGSAVHAAYDLIGVWRPRSNSQANLPTHPVFHILKPPQGLVSISRSGTKSPRRRTLHSDLHRAGRLVNTGPRP